MPTSLKHVLDLYKLNLVPVWWVYGLSAWMFAMRKSFFLTPKTLKLSAWMFAMRQSLFPTPKSRSPVFVR